MQLVPPRPVAVRRRASTCALALALALVLSALGAAFGQEGLPPPSAEAVSPGATIGGESVGSPPPSAEMVAEVRIRGNETIKESQIASKITTRAGRPFDAAVVQRDVRQLANQGWFVDVKPMYETTPQGRVVIFQVVERPTIRYVSYLGNSGVSDKNLGKQTNLKVGGSVDPYAVEEGRRKIHDYYTARGYNNVQITIIEGNKATDQGVIYLIDEGQKQRVWNVYFVGNEFVSSGRLKTLVKTKPPILLLFKGYIDREKVDSDIEQLTAYYRSYGYFQARIGRKIEYNEKGNWCDVTYVIHEGQRYQVRNVSFIGNTKFEQAAMAKQAKLDDGMPFEQAKMEQDAQWLQDLYGSHGFVFADVKAETVFLEQPGQVDLVYHIDEGQRWRVGRIFVHIGGDNPHTRIQTCLNRVTLRPGEIMDSRELKASERRLMASSLFNSDPATGDRPKITYHIPEDADLGVAERPHQREGVRGQSPDVFSPPLLAPPSAVGLAGVELAARGDVPPDCERLDVEVFCDDYEHYLRWVKAEEEAVSSPAIPSADDALESGPTEVGNGQLDRPLPRPSLQHGESDESSPRAAGESVGHGTPGIVIRGQSPQAAPPNNFWWSPTRRTNQRIANKPVNPYDEVRGQSPDGAVQNAYATLPAGGVAQQPYSSVPQYVGQPQYGGQTVRATGPESAPPAGSVQPALYSPYPQQQAPGGVQPAQYSPNLQPPAGSVYPQPLSPQGPLPGYSVDPTSPLYAAPTPLGVPNYPEGTVDIDIRANETQTGRLMLGVGVNSNAGVVGNIVVDERNFNWARPPQSWEDIRNGTAWRGDGERFRIDASPGSEVSRYLVSFQQPYFLNQPLSLGLSGSYYTRQFRDWQEQRLGGRVAFGYQWVDRDLTATVAYRGEDVTISRPSVGPGVVPSLDAVLGTNVLHGFRVSLINDTRDNQFLATQGHYIEVGGEQVIGSFSYPRVDLDARQYFLLHERPDHSGRHVLSGSTTVGVTGTHTPIYDNFFAGGFDTLRGFEFRGASPVQNNVQVGGEFQWINSIQYLFPITADEMLHGVVFTDFGTVEPKTEINDFRVAIGTGLRITVPAMGPAPIALDFAWAVNKAPTDQTQVFSFSLGFTR